MMQMMQRYEDIERRDRLAAEERKQEEKEKAKKAQVAAMSLITTKVKAATDAGDEAEAARLRNFADAVASGVLDPSIVVMLVSM